MTDDDPGGGSAPCFAQHLVAGQPVDPDTARDVGRFRRAQRTMLMQRRVAIPVAERAALTARLIETLRGAAGDVAGRRVAVYWPIRGEPDLRGWMAEAHGAGARVLLPVVVEKSAPLIFRHWQPGCEMERGDWNIPVPAQGAAEAPDLVISPLLGVDDACFRLGNGGGYYDRTLASLDPAPRVIGVGWPDCRIPTIYPMPWDVPMDAVALADGRIFGRDDAAR